jgi:hypothetical protein
VFRAWGGKEYQEYVRIKRSRKAAKAKAMEIDARLAKAQRAYSIQQAKSPEFHIRPDGRIRGLRRITITRKGRTPSEVFELRINVPWETDIKRTTISIGVHGHDEAFQLAVDKICEWYGLPQSSEVRTAMLESSCHYRQTKDAHPGNVAELAIQKAKDEFASLRGGLVKSLKRFTA